MPLPAITMLGAAQCTAQAKHSRQQCKNPAAYKCATCRMHGARRPSSIKHGADHPGYRHGQETLQAKAERSRRLGELRELEALSFDLALASGAKWRGRKPRVRKV